MANSFFVIEVEREKLKYWEIKRGQKPIILKQGVLPKEKPLVSEVIDGSKDLYILFSPSLVSSVKIELSNIKEKFVLKHLLLYKDKYFPIPSGKPLVKYFKMSDGGYMIFAIDEKLWEEIKDLFPNPRKVYGPTYWAFLPHILKDKRFWRRTYKGLSEIVGYSMKDISIFKRGPKGQIDNFLISEGLVEKTIEIKDEDIVRLLTRVKPKTLSSLAFQRIEIKERNTVVYITILLIILISLLFTGKTIKEKQLLEFEIKKVDAMIEKIKDEAEEIQKKQKKIEFLTDFIISYNEVIKEDSRPLELLKDLSNILPKGTQIEYIELEGSIIKDLEGKTLNATKLLLDLQKNKDFSDLKFKGAVTKEEDMDRFVIEGRFVPHETGEK